MNRREFIGHSAKAAAVFTAGATVLGRPGPARADAANDRITMALIGVGGRGRDLGRMFTSREDVVMKYVCDADLNRIDTYPEQLERMQDHPVEAVQDMRRIFDDPEVDAVCVATSDHWHGLATVWACQAGKDVYVEKPAAHNIWEGRKMVEAAEHYGRVVQVGMQNRSAPYVAAARAYIESGALGEIPLIKVFNLKAGGSFRMPEDSEAPEGLDYDLYLGPAPSRPFNRGHFHGSWNNWFDYCGGDMGDDGVHQIDIARILLEDPAPPSAVQGMGGQLAYPDSDGDVPDTQVVSFQYPKTVMTFELTNYAPYMQKTPPQVRDTDAFPEWALNATRIEVYGTRQKMVLGRHGGGWQVIAAGGEVVASEYGRQHTMEHIENFIECIRSRQQPNGNIEQGHQSSVLVHLGNTATVRGERLAFDGGSESFVANDDANNSRLRKRVYRDGFAVPEVV